MKKRMYYLAVTKDDVGCFITHRSRLSPKMEANSDEKLVGYLATNNRQVYLKNLLKAQLLELTSFGVYSADIIARDKSVSAGLAESTSILCWEWERFLMGRIYRTVRSLMREGILVTDELAISCYNFIASERQKECI